MAICHCRSSLLSDSRFLFSSHWTQISSDIGTAMLLTTARWRLPVAHVEKRWLECCHLSTPSLTAACAGPACVQHAFTVAIYCSQALQFVYMCVLFCDLQPEVPSHSVDSYTFNCSMFCSYIQSGSPPQCCAFSQFTRCKFTLVYYGWRTSCNLQASQN